MRNLLDYFSSDKKKTGKPLRCGLLARAWGVYSVFMLEDVASDKRLNVGSISSTVPFKIVLQKGLTVDFEKSPGLGLFGKSGAGEDKQRFFLFPSSILSRWLPGFTC